MQESQTLALKTTLIVIDPLLLIVIDPYKFLIFVL